MHSVRHVIRSRILTSVQPGQSVHEAAVIMADSGIGAVPVVEGDQLVGIFSQRDLLTRVVVPGLDPSATRVSEVMTRDVITADVGDRTDPCAEKMLARRCRHLPVTSGGKVIAMLSLRDVLSDELEERDEEIRNLRAYIHQEGPH